MNIRNYPTKLALASITLVSAVSLAPKAFAQQNVIFEGNVVASCAFTGTPTNGTLALATGSVDSLSTTTQGVVQAQCNTQNARVNINQPTADTVPGGEFPSNYSYSATLSSGSFSTNTIGSDVVTSGIDLRTPTSFNLSLGVNSTTAFTPGNYQFTVAVDILPN